MEEIKINGVDAFVALLKAVMREQKTTYMLSGTNDAFVLFLYDFVNNLREKGYSDEDIENFNKEITLKIAQGKYE